MAELAEHAPPHRTGRAGAMGNYLLGAQQAEEGKDDGSGQPTMINNNATQAPADLAGGGGGAAPAAAAATGLQIETGAGSAWSTFFGGRRAQQSPSHALLGPTPVAPTRYRVLPRGVQGLWTFRHAVEATLVRTGYDDKLWQAFEAGFEPVAAPVSVPELGMEEGKGERTTVVVSSSGSAMVGMKRRSPGAVVGAAAAAAQQSVQAQRQQGQRRPPLPSQLLPAILRWADVCKEVTLLKMEDVHVANGDYVYLRYGLPESLHGYKVVAVHVVVQAHDQGWSSFPQDHGTTRGSCTWADLIVEAPPRETNHSQPNVVATAELFRNLHAVRRWQTHVARLEDYDGGAEEEERLEKGPLIGQEEQATPPPSPGHPHPAPSDEQAEAEAEAEAEAAKQRRERVAVVKALQPGATLSLQLSARYPGWVHYARHASLTVRFIRDE